MIQEFMADVTIYTTDGDYSSPGVCMLVSLMFKSTIFQSFVP